jgi:uncharacterized peroxidase-related enzyme
VYVREQKEVGVFIEPVAPDTAEGLTAEIFEKAREDMGFLPEFVQTFSHHPEAYLAWEQLITTVYDGMDRRRAELATLAAARTMKSTCCATSHGRTLRNRFFTVDEVIQIATDHHQAGLDDAEKAIIDFAEKAATEPHGVTQTDVNVLRDRGLTDREIFDIAFAVAARAFLVTLIESLGNQAEQTWVDDLEPELLEVLEVGRPAK